MDHLIPEPGDIYVYGGPGYCHFAIISGNGNVIHVTVADNTGGSLGKVMNSLRDPTNKAAVKEEKVQFSDIIQLPCVDNSFDSQIDPFPADEIVARARSKLGPWNYDLVKNNCEHFARWCRYGINLCRQLLYKYDTGDSMGVGYGSLTAGPVRLHLPSIHGKAVEEEGKKEVELGVQAAGAEFGFVRAGVGAAVKTGYNTNDGVGFTAETRFAEARAGPVSAKLGLGVSTGVHNNEDSTGFQVLGTGVDVGKHGVGVNVLGSRAECSIM